MTRRLISVLAVCGILLVGVSGCALGDWAAGLTTDQTAQGQPGVSNLRITTTVSGSSTSLYPGGTGDVMVTIFNPNSYPVTITAVGLPANTMDATGYTGSGLSKTRKGCLATAPSGVTWYLATSTSGSWHRLVSALTVGGRGQPDDPLEVTFVHGASMEKTAPAACAATYFSLPSFTGVIAVRTTATPTISPFTDDWTS